MRPPSLLALVAALASLAGACRHAPAAGGEAPCPLELLDHDPPPPFEILGPVQALVTSGGEHPEEALRAPACALGADAVVITRRFVTNDYGHVLVGGTALRRRPGTTEPVDL